MDEHSHQDKRGMWHMCYHHCRHWTSPKFLLGFTAAFYAEHILTEKVPPFSYLTHWLGL